MRLNFKILMIGILGLTFLTQSCQTVIEYDFPETDPKLVLNTFFNPDSIWKVNLTKSKGSLESGSFDFVTGANLKLFENGQLVSDFIYAGNGNYTSSIGAKPKIGGIYEIVASHNQFETVNAFASVPTPTSILKVDTFSRVFQGIEMLTATVSFNDDGNLKNYYSINARIEGTIIYQYDSLFPADTIHLDGPLYFSFEETRFYENAVYTPDGIIITDDFFNGQQNNINLNIDKYSLYLNTEGFETPENLTVFFELRTISEDMYLYLKTFQQQQGSLGPFTQPVQVYNNITGGFGIFAGYSTSSKPFILF